jgi:hypothetical protein
MTMEFPRSLLSAASSSRLLSKLTRSHPGPFLDRVERL